MWKHFKSFTIMSLIAAYWSFNIKFCAYLWTICVFTACKYAWICTWKDWIVLLGETLYAYQNTWITRNLIYPEKRKQNNDFPGSKVLNKQREVYRHTRIYNIYNCRSSRIKGKPNGGISVQIFAFICVSYMFVCRLHAMYVTHFRH